MSAHYLNFLRLWLLSGRKPSGPQIVLNQSASEKDIGERVAGGGRGLNGGEVGTARRAVIVCRITTGAVAQDDVRSAGKDSIANIVAHLIAFDTAAVGDRANSTVVGAAGAAVCARVIADDDRFSLNINPSPYASTVAPSSKQRKPLTCLERIPAMWRGCGLTSKRQRP